MTKPRESSAEDLERARQLAGDPIEPEDEPDYQGEPVLRAEPIAKLSEPQLRHRSR